MTADIENNSNRQSPILTACPYCKQQILDHSILKPDQQLSLEQVTDILENKQFVFLGFTEGRRMFDQRFTSGSENYHCYKCRRSITLSYDQFK